MRKAFPIKYSGTHLHIEMEFLKIFHKKKHTIQRRWFLWSFEIAQYVHSRISQRFLNKYGKVYGVIYVTYVYNHIARFHDLSLTRL
jgi:hypothetical protein